MLLVLDERLPRVGSRRASIQLDYVDRPGRRPRGNGVYDDGEVSVIPQAEEVERVIKRSHYGEAWTLSGYDAYRSRAGAVVSPVLAPHTSYDHSAVNLAGLLLLLADASVILAVRSNHRHVEKMSSAGDTRVVVTYGLLATPSQLVVR